MKTGLLKNLNCLVSGLDQVDRIYLTKELWE